jgi:GDP-L-fucose synthase
MNLISSEDKIAIFGSKGMAGGAICRALKNKGYNKLLMPTRQELDLLFFNALEKWFEINRPNVVVIAAAKVGGIYANNNYPADFILENLKIQNNIIEIAWRKNVKKLLFLGSSCIYPKFSKQPIPEEALLSGDLEPTNQWYAIAKISGIKLCEALKKQYDFNAISLMPTNLYGPGDNYHPQNSHVLPGLIRRFCEAKEKKQKKVVCWGTGSPYREFLHVDDLGQACVFALEKWDLDQENAPKGANGESLPFLNVGTGTDISIKDLAYLIAKYVEFDGEIIWDTSKPDGTPKKQLDVARINSIGWYPRISINDGVRETIDLYKKFQLP